jgi:nucleotide-binding universal stress UspA family protein
MFCASAHVSRRLCKGSLRGTPGASSVEREVVVMPDQAVESPKKPFVLVLGLDIADQESSGYACDQAMRIASRITDCVLHIVHVVPEATGSDRILELAQLLRLYVSEKSAALGIRTPSRAGIHVRIGETAKTIAQFAADIDADMIVVGKRKALHASAFTVGSTAVRVMDATSCPVFVAGPRPRVHPSHVIVIDAPCPDCVERRQQTGGQAWWCDRHSESHHLHHVHHYSYHGELDFTQHDSSVIPTGVD